MEEIRCNVLVIGGGAAGSRAAYEAKRFNSKLNVILAVAGKYGNSGSTDLVASEALGINAPFNFEGDGDTPDIYYKDIVSTGGGLANPKLCRIIADESTDRLRELIHLGVKFGCKNGKPIQNKLSGCTKARSLTCGGSTGREIVRAFKKANHELGVRVVENTRIVELIKDKNGKVCGAIALKENRKVVFLAEAIVLATGGTGAIFSKNINPPALVGDGWAMAYQAGAKLTNMEFYQIGPAVVKPRIQFIIHSHMWRFAPKLTNALGEEFLPRYCPGGIDPLEVIEAKAMSYPFSVRTIAKYLDIAIFKEIIDGRGTENGGIYFDVRHAGAEKLEKLAPITYRTLKNAGVDLAEEKIELGLVVQNFNGGITIDENGFTGVPGLYAAGEVSGGIHGSDRPGGNNLIDTQVFGYRAGKAAAHYALENGNSNIPSSIYEKFSAKMELGKRERELLRNSEEIYYKEMTIVRTDQGLCKVLDFIEENLNENNSLIFRNRLLVGQILAQAELTRKESRGTHYREDYPESDSEWEKRIVISKGTDLLPHISITDI